jgi:hypothetical protein
MGLVTVVMFAAGVWMVSYLLQMMPVEDLTSPVSALVMALSVAAPASLAMKIHSQMDKTFRRTLLGDGSSKGGSVQDESSLAGD